VDRRPDASCRVESASSHGYHASMSLTEPKGRMTIDTMVDVIRRVEGMSLAAKEKMFDELAATQPEALSCALALPQLGVSMPVLDRVLHLVLVIAEAVSKTAGRPLPRITLDMIKQAAEKTAAWVKLLEGETDAEADRLTGIMVNSHPESNLFAYVAGYLHDKGLTRSTPEHERAVFAVAVVLETFLQAASLTAGDSR